MFSPKRVSKILIIIILILALKLLLVNIEKPFWGHHDWNSVVYSIVARNYVRYGFIETKLGQVTNVDPQNQNSLNFITHYPPLLPILISLSFRILGQTETAARLIPLAFSLLLVFCIYLLGSEIHSKLLGIFASLTAIVTPIFLYFGKLPVHDTIVPAISTLGFWLYLKFVREEKNKYYILLVTSVIIGGLLNWSAFYLVIALLFIHTMACVKFAKMKIYALIPLSILVFLTHVLHVKFLGVETKNVFSNVLERINPYLTADLYGFTLTTYFKQELLFLKIYFSVLILLGSAIFLLIFLKNFAKKRNLFREIFIIGMLIYGISQLVIFSQLSFIHDYMIYYLTPYMILSYSLITFTFLKKIKKKIIFPAVLFFVISFSFLSGLKYTNALLKTSMHRRGYEVAKIINSQVASGSRAFIGSNSYREFEGPFIAYYSDREVSYGESLPSGFENEYKLILRPRDHDALDYESKKLLDSNFIREEKDHYIIYKL